MRNLIQLWIILTAHGGQELERPKATAYSTVHQGSQRYYDYALVQGFDYSLKPAHAHKRSLWKE